MYHPSIVHGYLSQSYPRALGRIENELWTRFERSKVVGYQEDEADRHAMSELVEDVRDAVIEYQVGLEPLVASQIFCLGTVKFSQQKLLYDNNCRLIVCPGSSVVSHLRH